MGSVTPDAIRRRRPFRLQEKRKGREGIMDYNVKLIMLFTLFFSAASRCVSY